MSHYLKKSILAITFLSTLAAFNAQAAAYFNVFGGATQAQDISATVTPPGIKATLEHKTGYDAGFAIGYKNGPVRLEGQYTYLVASYDDIKVAGFKLKVDGQTKANIGLANIYYDFLQLSDNFAPFVGIGVGVANLKPEATVLGTTITQKSDNQFAYQGTVGVNMFVGDNSSIGVSYRYLATNDRDFKTNSINFGYTYHFS